MSPLLHKISLLILLHSFFLTAAEQSSILRPLVPDCTSIYSQIWGDPAAQMAFSDRMSEEGDIRGTYSQNSLMIKELKSSGEKPELLKKLIAENEEILKQLKNEASKLGLKDTYFSEDGLLVEADAQDTNRAKLPLFDLYSANPRLRLLGKYLLYLEDPLISMLVEGIDINTKKPSAKWQKESDLEQDERIDYLESDLQNYTTRATVSMKKKTLIVTIEDYVGGEFKTKTDFSDTVLVARDLNTKQIVGVGITKNGITTIDIQSKKMPEELEIFLGSDYTPDF